MTSVQQHPASVDAYIRHGWALVPIPHGTKGPRNTDWNKREAALKTQSDLPHGYGIGLAHAYSGTMALDIDDWDTACMELSLNGVDLQELYRANDAVIIDSGRQGHGKLIYRMPSGLTLPSKKIILNKKTIYELRCATASGLTVQDVLPPTIHPGTGKSYRWIGNGHWSRLPPVPDTILNLWKRLIEVEKQRTMEMGDGSIDASWSEIKTAVEFIDPNTTRDEWINVGMALHWAGMHSDNDHESFAIWDEWSRESPEKYPGERTMVGQWNSFKADKATSITLGTLFHIAKSHGWERPMPDASELFSQVDSPDNPKSIIENLRPSPPNIDLDLFPDILATRAREISDQVGCDPLVPLFAGLSAACAVVDARTRLELMDGFQVPPVLWLMTIGSPADKKSPGSRPIFEIMKTLELEDRPRYRQAILDWEGLEAAHKSSKSAYLDWAASPDALLDGEAPPVTELPDKPAPLRITVSDITSQKLVRHANEHPRGLLCYLDEMNSWVKKLTDKNSGEDRSAWVVSYESEAYTMDRVGAGSICCDNLAVSIYGNIQPKVFRQHLNAMSADGLLQRFIPAVLRGDCTRMGNPIPDHLTRKTEWEQILRLIFATPVQTFRLSQTAYETFRRFQAWYEIMKQDERLLNQPDAYMTAFGKLEGTAGRLILIFHLIENPFSPLVEVSVVDRVIKFIKTFVIQSFRYTFGEVGGEGSFDVWLTDHIIRIAGDQDIVTLRELKHSARRKLDGMNQWQAEQTIIDSMSMLETSQWVKLFEDNQAKHRMIWAINPDLKTMFQEYRNKIDNARRRVKI